MSSSTLLVQFEAGVSLPQSPGVALTSLMLIQTTFSLLTLIPYYWDNLLPLAEFLNTIMKTVCLSGFFVTCLLIIRSQTPRIDNPANPTIQLFGMLFILLGIIFSYVFTLLRVVRLVGAKIAKNRTQQRNEGTKENSKVGKKKGFEEDLTLARRG